jgi:hypothetical protein
VKFVAFIGKAIPEILHDVSNKIVIFHLINLESMILFANADKITCLNIVHGSDVVDAEH